MAAGGDPVPAYLVLSTLAIGSPDGLGVVVPIVSPPPVILVNGADASQGVSGVTPSPVIAWEEPAVGAASMYELEVIHIGLRAGTTRTELRLVAQCLTSTRDIKVPDGIMVGGESYVVRITAHANNGGRALGYARSATGILAP